MAAKCSAGRCAVVAVQAQPRGGHTPGLHPALRISEVDEVLTAQEVLPHRGHHPLHSWLVLGMAHPRRIAAKPPGRGVVQPAHREPGVHRVRVGYHRGQVVRILWPALLCGRGSTAPFAVVVNGAVGSFLAT